MCKNYLPLHSSFTFILECSVFPIQSSDVCSKTRLIRKMTCETLRGANTAGVVRAFSESGTRGLFNVLLELKSCFNVFFFLLICLRIWIFVSYIKQIMNVSHSCNGTNFFIRWKMKFASLNGTFHLSPHENICTIALIDIHFLYIIDQQESPLLVYSLICSSFTSGHGFDFRLGHMELWIYLALVCLVNIAGKVSGEGDVWSVSVL